MCFIKDHEDDVFQVGPSSPDIIPNCLGSGEDESRALPVISPVLWVALTGEEAEVVFGNREYVLEGVVMLQRERPRGRQDKHLPFLEILEPRLRHQHRDYRLPKTGWKDNERVRLQR